MIICDRSAGLGGVGGGGGRAVTLTKPSFMDHCLLVPAVAAVFKNKGHWFMD